MHNRDQFSALDPTSYPFRSAPRAAGQAKALLRFGVAAAVMLFVQYMSGIALNLYVDVPASDAHRGMFESALHAMAHSPLVLAAHAALGTALIVLAVAVSMYAWSVRSKSATAASVLGLLFLVGAWMSGAAFVDRGQDSSSLVMGLLAGCAAACYFTVSVVAARFHTRVASEP
jgi:hypothetical protein